MAAAGSSFLTPSGGGISIGGAPLQTNATNPLQRATNLNPAAGSAILTPAPTPPPPASLNNPDTNGYGSYTGGNSNGSTTAANSAASNYQDKTADINMQNAGLGSVDATRDAGLSALNKALGTVTGQYEGDLNTARNEYGSTTNANQADLQTNKQTALERAVEGRQGLYSTLASLGALNGTGLDLANNAVQRGANQDLTTAADTAATNQRGLDTNYNTYTTNEQRLEQKAKDAGANDTQQGQNDAARSKMGYLTNLANDYTAEGNTAAAKTYADQAAALYPSIASTNIPTIDLGYTGAAYTAPTLASYLGQANNTSVQTTPATGGGVLNIPGLIAMNKKQTA